MTRFEWLCEDIKNWFKFTLCMQVPSAEVIKKEHQKYLDRELKSLEHLGVRRIKEAIRQMYVEGSSFGRVCFNYGYFPKGFSKLMFDRFTENVCSEFASLGYGFTWSFENYCDDENIVCAADVTITF